MIIALQIYLALISVAAIVVTSVDKYRAVHGMKRNRISEATLITLSLLGGSVAMLFTMTVIRHKTQKPKFMLGIPLIIAFQLGLIYFLVKQGVLVI